MNDGGPAFPAQTDGEGRDFVSGRLDERNGMPYYVLAHGGMSLRDYFAAHALVGVMSSPEVLTACALHYPNDLPYAVSKMAQSIANAMLAARTTPTPLGPVTNDRPQ